MLIDLEYRPWNAWTRKSGQKLATLLQDFGISSRGFHHGDAPGFRGYLFQSFKGCMGTLSAAFDRLSWTRLSL
jgi:hypothetical protein